MKRINKQEKSERTQIKYRNHEKKVESPKILKNK